MKSISFEHLIDVLKSLPGIGNKQAERIAYFLIQKDNYYIEKLLSTISNAHTKIKFCKQCNNFSENELCDICANPSRDKNQLCIVSSIEDLIKIENTNTYVGLYYVLNGEVNVKTRTNLDQNIVKRLMDLINKNNFIDITIATNWTIDGEATAVFIKKIINQLSKANVYRIALGLPINSALDYADNTTLAFAFKNKTKY